MGTDPDRPENEATRREELLGILPMLAAAADTLRWALTANLGPPEAQDFAIQKALEDLTAALDQYKLTDPSYAAIDQALSDARRKLELPPD